MGTSPIKDVPLPRGYFLWKVTKPGFAETTGAGPTWWSVVSLRLAPEGAVPDGMVLVPSADSLGGVIGIAAVEGPHDPYFIDRYEVTNRQFKQFVDQGGYQKREYWKTPFVREGKPVSWDEAMAVFRDTTGRPGPSTWEGGTFATGHDDLPVSGVSWYEAAAYAEFVGKSLPTISHWFLAADIRVSPLIIPASNFAGKGLAKVGSYPSIGPFGTYDMAGNAQEWAWNETDDGFRFILGGAWSSPTTSSTSLTRSRPSTAARRTASAAPATRRRREHRCSGRSGARSAIIRSRSLSATRPSASSAAPMRTRRAN